MVTGGADDQMHVFNLQVWSHVLGTWVRTCWGFPPDGEDSEDNGDGDVPDDDEDDGYEHAYQRGFGR